MKSRVIIIMLLLAVIATGALLWTKRAGREAGAGAMTFYGNVDIREAQLGFRVAGRLAEVLKQEGDPVLAGDLLARLDPEPYLKESAEAQARVASAKARLRLLRSGARTQEIAQARALLTERQVSLENAQRVYTRQEELLSANTVSQQERDDAEARFREAEARLNSAREQLNLLEAGFRPEEIEQAETEVERAEAGAALAALRVDDTELRAPADGVVLTRVHEPGAVLQPGTTVLSVSLPRPVWVRAYVEQPLLGRVKPGGRAQVFTDTRKGRPFSGRIGYVSPRAEFTPKTVETPELRTSLVYRFRVIIDEPDDSLRQGMPVTVKLVE